MDNVAEQRIVAGTKRARGEPGEAPGPRRIGGNASFPVRHEAKTGTECRKANERYAKSQGREKAKKRT